MPKDTPAPSLARRHWLCFMRARQEESLVSCVHLVNYSSLYCPAKCSSLREIQWTLGEACHPLVAASSTHWESCGPSPSWLVAHPHRLLPPRIIVSSGSFGWTNLYSWEDFWNLGSSADGCSYSWRNSAHSLKSSFPASAPWLFGRMPAFFMIY